jgi:hypothetical protein
VIVRNERYAEIAAVAVAPENVAETIAVEAAGANDRPEERHVGDDSGKPPGNNVCAAEGLSVQSTDLASKRVVERRPDVRLVTYNRHTYRRWLGSRPDSEELRTV